MKEIIKKGELLEFGFAHFGVEDEDNRFVAEHDLIVEEVNSSDGMSFGAAIEMMKRGKKVARNGWNVKGMYIRDTLPCLGSIRMFTENKEVIKEWTASQTDMLSEDWIVVED